MYRKGKTYKASIKSLITLLNEGWSVNGNGYLVNPDGKNLYGFASDNPIFGKTMNIRLIEESVEDTMPWRTSSRTRKINGYYIPNEIIEKIYA